MNNLDSNLRACQPIEIVTKRQLKLDADEDANMLRMVSSSPIYSKELPVAFGLHHDKEDDCNRSSKLLIKDD